MRSHANTAEEFVDEIYRESFQPVPREPVHVWAKREVKNDETSPIPGNYDIHVTPYLMEPLETFQSDSVRHQITVGPNQGGRTKVMEVACIWSAIYRPGPMQWNTDTNDKASDHAEERFWPMAEEVKQLRNLYPKNLDNKRKCKIIFQNGMPFTIQGANPTNLEQKSIQTQFNDECYKWGIGLLNMAHKRGDVSYAATRKVWDSSVPGDEGHDFHTGWEDSTRGEWCFECKQCGRVQPFVFLQVKWDTNETTRPSGDYDFRELAKTVYYQCENENCKCRYEDSATSREEMNLSGRYVHANPRAQVVGHRYNVLAVNWPGVRWASWVAEFLAANKHFKMFGDSTPLQKFWCRRMAEFWEETRFCNPVDVRQKSDYQLSEPNHFIANNWDDEVIRFLASDKQEFGYPVCIRAVKRGGASRLLFYKVLASYDEIEAYAKMFRVKPQCVLIDCNFERGEVFGECIKRGWTAFVGDGAENFIHKIKHPITGVWTWVRRPYSPVQWGDPGMGQKEQQRNKARGAVPRWKLARFYQFSNLTIKNMLNALKQGRSGIYWGVASDIAKAYIEEINSEVRYRILSARGRVTYLWSNAGRNGKKKKKPNHAWDCECMILTASIMQGLIDLEQFTRKVPDVELNAVEETEEDAAAVSQDAA